MHALGRPQAATGWAERAIAVDPLNAMAHALRGYSAIQELRPIEAARWLRRAIALAPNYFEPLNNLASAIEQISGPPDVVLWATRALCIRPDSPEARLTCANARLALGRWHDAWPDYELRLKLQHSYPHSLNKPRWAGNPLPNGTLLVHDEIGYGDVFNFLRYVPMARARVGRLIFEVKPGLRNLFDGFTGIDHVVERTDVPLPPSEYDCFIPIESLPGLFGATPQTVPTENLIPSLPPALLDRWAIALRGTERMRVGIVWAGSPTSGLDRTRSCTLNDLSPLAAITGIDWVSLQHGPAASEVADGTFPAPLRGIGSSFANFSDTAAVIQQLDAVVTVDTAVAHLAGLLGRPTLVLLSRWPAWRWLLNRQDSPWYRTVKLFRQSRPGIWLEPVAAAEAHLRALRDRHRAANSN